MMNIYFPQKFSSFLDTYRWQKLLLVKFCMRITFHLVGIFLLFYIVSYVFVCFPLITDDLQGNPRHKILCMDFHGGIGNQFFHYAFAYSKAREKNLQLIIENDNMLTEYFNVLPNSLKTYGYNTYCCYCFKKYRDNRFHNGYDTKFENLPDNKDLAFHGYFQSWRYWLRYEPELRQIFQIKPKFLNEARLKLRQILASNEIMTITNITLIGVHIRKFTFYETEVFGKRYAPKSYLKNAMNLYKKHFPNCLFLVCANDIKWAKEILADTNDVHIVEGNSGIVDMALLTLTNHTLMTVGTYGWVTAWLTKGKTVYYKHPDKPGSSFSKLYSDYSDHFYPGWIGLE